MAKKIFQNIDTREERKGALQEHGYWAAFTLLFPILTFVLWAPELSHMYGWFTFCTWMVPITAIAGIAFIFITNHPDNDKYKWWITGAVVFFFFFSVGFRANYRFTDPKSRWDYKATTSQVIVEKPMQTHL